MVFHLDKCIGCHTCSLACKNLWTDRKGAEYMYWNNVETKPGTGYPTQWEDQKKYKGGWWTRNGNLGLLSTDKLRGYTNIFHQPHLPTIRDYFEPWTYDYGNLFNAPQGDDQPTARPISQITGEYMDIDSGPNWDDDLSGSPMYAANDPNLDSLSEDERKAIFDIERLVFFYLPRICNHCLNPACVAACQSGAIYKRGEDGIVLIDQNICRGWRFCVSACPYKKTYFNWQSGKSEKCVLCYPKLESGQVPGCMHSCVGRIRYLGVLLYNADLIKWAASAPDSELVSRQREIILDPGDPEVIRHAKKSGVHDSVIEYAQKSPVYKFVKDWKMALPLHSEARTLPMLFYVPPLLPLLGKVGDSGYAVDAVEYFATSDSSRVSLKYLARLLSAGNVDEVVKAYRPMIASRIMKRQETVGDADVEKLNQLLKKTGLTRKDLQDIYELSAISTFDQRFVVPPSHREYAIEILEEPDRFKAETGFGYTARPGKDFEK
jgi:nitrate reductase beta subunit